MVQYALFIRKPWCQKIFDEGKSWELRSYPLPADKKGEVVAVACSKENVLLGEIRLKGCLKVGSKRDGVWQPASNSEKHVKNFFLDKRNGKKTGFGEDLPDVIKGYKNMYAWLIRDPKKYDVPRPWRPTRGPVVFCKIKPGPEEPKVALQ